MSFGLSDVLPGCCSSGIAAIGEVYYTRDPNRVTFRDDAAGVAQPTFEKEHALGGNLILQARF